MEGDIGERDGTKYSELYAGFVARWREVWRGVKDSESTNAEERKVVEEKQILTQAVAIH